MTPPLQGGFQNAMNTIASIINQFSQAADKVNQKLLFVAGIILLVLVPSLRSEEHTSELQSQ